MGTIRQKQQRLLDNADAKIWADEFMRLYAEPEYREKLDHGLMIGWFANAIMAGYDLSERKQCARIAELERQLEQAAWTISPAMAQAKIDQLNEQVDRLSQELKVANERNVVLEQAVTDQTALRERYEAWFAETIAQLHAKLAAMTEERDRLRKMVDVLVFEGGVGHVPHKEEAS